MKGYLKADNWEERLKFVKDPEELKATFKEYYSGYKGPTQFQEIQFPKDVDFARDRLIDIKVVFSRSTDMRGLPTEESAWYVLEKEGADWKIDWEASVGHNIMSEADFLKQRPIDPVPFRVIARLKKGRNQDELELSTSQGSFPSLPYQKDSEWGKRIWPYIQDERPHAMILLLRNPNSQIEVVDWVTNGWVQPKDAPKESRSLAQSR